MAPPPPPLRQVRAAVNRTLPIPLRSDPAQPGGEGGGVAEGRVHPPHTARGSGSGRAGEGGHSSPSPSREGHAEELAVDHPHDALEGEGGGRVGSVGGEGRGWVALSTYLTSTTTRTHALKGRGRGVRVGRVGVVAGGGALSCTLYLTSTTTVQYCAGTWAPWRRGKGRCFPLERNCSNTHAYHFAKTKNRSLHWSESSSMSGRSGVGRGVPNLGVKPGFISFTSRMFVERMVEAMSDSGVGSYGLDYSVVERLFECGNLPELLRCALVAAREFRGYLLYEEVAIFRQRIRDAYLAGAGGDAIAQRVRDDPTAAQLQEPITRQAALCSVFGWTQAEAPTPTEMKESSIGMGEFLDVVRTVCTYIDTDGRGGPRYGVLAAVKPAPTPCGAKTAYAVSAARRLRVVNAECPTAAAAGIDAFGVRLASGAGAGGWAGSVAVGWVVVPFVVIPAHPNLRRCSWWSVAKAAICVVVSARNCSLLRLAIWVVLISSTCVTTIAAICVVLSCCTRAVAIALIWVPARPAICIVVSALT